MKRNKSDNKINKVKKHFTLAAILIAIVCFSLYAGLKFYNSQAAREVNSFEECVAAGGAVAEKFPPVCYLNDGRSFEQH